MATQVEFPPNCPIPGDERLYRALNPKHSEDGLPGDNHFVMKQNHEMGDGVSTGIARSISLAELRSIEVITRICGTDFAIAELVTAEVLAPVAPLGITVVQQDSVDWGAFCRAHAVITGYQALRGNEGRRQIRDFQRHLVKLARRRYYPQGSEVAAAVEATS